MAVKALSTLLTSERSGVPSAPCTCAAGNQHRWSAARMSGGARATGKGARELPAKQSRVLPARLTLVSCKALQVS